MELELTEESLGSSDKHHQPLVKGCWGREPIIPPHVWPTDQDTKRGPMASKSPRQRNACADRSWAAVHLHGKDRGGAVTATAMP